METDIKEMKDDTAQKIKVLEQKIEANKYIIL